jgi:hypothetical protein
MTVILNADYYHKLILYEKARLTHWQTITFYEEEQVFAWWLEFLCQYPYVEFM